MDVSGKKAVIFGGTSGIGLATSKQLAALGAKVIAVSRNPERAGEVADGIILKQCDTTDREAVAVLCAECAPIDVLISAATGGQRAIGPFLEMDLDGYQASFQKLWGYANVVRYGAEHVVDGGSITLVSGSPARNCRPGQVSLSCVGGAVEALVRAVAKEIAPNKRINVVSPGTIDTPMTAFEGEERKNFYANATKNNLIPRAGTADEVAKGIVFVVQNEFVTGTTVDVDGGWLFA